MKVANDKTYNNLKVHNSAGIPVGLSLPTNGRAGNLFSLITIAEDNSYLYYHNGIIWIRLSTNKNGLLNFSRLLQNGNDADGNGITNIGPINNTNPIYNNYIGYNIAIPNGIILSSSKSSHIYFPSQNTPPTISYRDPNNRNAETDITLVSGSTDISGSFTFHWGTTHFVGGTNTVQTTFNIVLTFANSFNFAPNVMVSGYSLPTYTNANTYQVRFVSNSSFEVSFYADNRSDILFNYICVLNL